MLETDRLLLRRWTAADHGPFAALNADPEVMAHYPAPLDRVESDALIERIEAHFDDLGYGLWAVELRATGELLGYTGLLHHTFPAPFTPAVEVGWRFARTAWGAGYATEAARRAVTHGFDEIGLTEIVSMTAVGNVRSRRVMERLGMTHDPTDDFAHPKLPPDSPLRPHVLYRLTRDTWRSRS